MKSLFESMTDYLAAKNLRYSRAEDCTSLVVCYRLDHVNVTCIITIDEESRYLSFCTRSGMAAPSDKYSAVTDFISRANCGLNIGALQFNHGDGDIFFKTSFFTDAAEVSPGVIRHLLSKSINTYDLLHPGLVDVVYRDIDPAQALQNVKTPSKPQYSQEDIDAVFAKLMAGMEEPQPATDFDAILARVEEFPDGVLLPMKELVNASGQHRAGKHIVRRIEKSLQAHGLGHEPATLPRSQSGIVRIFKRENAA